MPLLKRVLKRMRRIEKIPVYIPTMYSSILEGKTVLITGGAGGIGAAIAGVCASNGACVVISGRNEKKLNEMANEIRKKVKDSKVEVLPFDVQDASKFRYAINALEQKGTISRIDVLINNAGISKGKALGGTSEEDYNQTMDVNLKGTYFMSQEFSNYLIDRGIPGNILNISSVSGVRPAISPYMISKWGITGLTRGLAKKLIPYDIVVNGIAPGPTTTDMLGLKNCELNYDKSPAGRYVTPTEVANLAVFLISDMGRMIVGETVCISGGCGNLTVDDIDY